MNWGYKITVAYLVFVFGILFLVYKTSQEKKDLVTEDYYEKELKYQQVIDASKRTALLSSELKYEVLKNKILITFPDEFINKDVSGEIEIYCPSDENKDVRKSFNHLKNNCIEMSTSNTGLQVIYVNWICEGLSYSYEKKIFI